MKFEYLIFNLIIFISPVLGGLVYKKTVWPDFKNLLTSLVLAALPFLIWDQLVTGLFWDFNSKFITDVKIGRLPVEEILFFFTVPFACLFLWLNFKRLFKSKILKTKYLVFFLIIISLILGGSFLVRQIYYSGLTMLFFGLVMVLGLGLKTALFRQKQFWFFLIIVFLLTLVFNSYLTARPIVTYNPLFKTNINLYTVPIEDFIYGQALLILNLILYHRFTRQRTG